MHQRRSTGRLAWLTLAVILAGSASVDAGVMHHDFADLLVETPADHPLTGLVMLSEQCDLSDVRASLASLGLTSRWRRHQIVVQRAQQLAATTQSDLLQTLESWRREGVVRSYRSFWVTNMVVVEALPEVFHRLADRADVGTIFMNSELQLRADPGETIRTARVGVREPLDGHVCVNVQSAWDRNYRGQGRLVAVFDTGADGNHPAFAERWRGAQDGVEWWEAWKDPYDETTFPWDSHTHGTHALGIAVGDVPGGDPIGIAYQAEWIAAGCLIGYNVDKIIECYEWAVDPDGDPSTIDDVPDVINNSWGTFGDCEMTYWNAIDVVEAAGIVNVIAVDNSGPDTTSVNSPESSADSPTVNWSVGNVNPHDPAYPISASSGRGPSPCDSVSIKPEVAAPGVDIYSALPNGNYGTRSGTSAAAPHAAGAVALLRQVNPELTVDAIKEILMATAFDRGEPGEDNTYGWGIIDIGAAVDSALYTVPPYPPRDLTAEVVDHDVTLAWVVPERIVAVNPLLAYHIYRAPFDEPFGLDPIDELPALISPLEYVDEDVPADAYHYVVTAVYRYNESGPSNEVEAFVLDPQSAGDLPRSPGVPLRIHPNPFNPVTVITFAIPLPSPMRLVIYDAAGGRVKTLIESPLAHSGEQSILWDGTDTDGNEVASGSYFVRLEQDGGFYSRSITLLK